MAQANTFPTFIRAEYDGSSGGFRELERSAQLSGTNVKRQFQTDMEEVKRTIVNALTMPKNAAGALDFNTAGMRQAAAEAQNVAVATRQVAIAAETAARREGDLSVATRTRVQAFQAAADAAERDALNLAQNARAYEKLQVEIDRVAASSGRMANEAQSAVTANSRLVASQGALRQASIGAGQQLQDIAISIYSGQRAGVVFAQQVPQMMFALSGLEGSTNKTANRIGQFAGFLSGPWGIAVGLGAGVLATFVSSLFTTDEALQKVEFSSFKLNEAQSILGGVIDITTGKINNQNAALQGLAQAQLLVAKVQAQGRLAEARRGVTAIQDRKLVVDGGFGGGINIGRRDRDGRDVISQQVLSGDLTSKKAVDQLEQLRRIGRLTDEEFTAAATSVANLGLELENLKVFDSANRLLNGEATAGDRNLLVKPNKPRKARTGSDDADKAARAARQLEDAIDQSADAVERLRGQFDQAPKDIDKVAEASRDLDNILKDIERRSIGGKRSAADKARDDATLRQIEDAKKNLLPQFLQRPIESRIKAGERELELQRLVLSGREDEAEILSFQYDIMRQMGVETEDQLRKELEGRKISWDRYQALVKQREEMIVLQRAQERLDRAGRSVASQLREIDGIRGSIEEAIARAPKDAAGAVKDLVGNIQQQFRQFSARQLTDQLFGDVFENLENELRAKSPLGRATREFVEGSDKATDAMARLTSGFDAVFASLPGAANDNATSRIRTGYSRMMGGFPISVDGWRSDAMPNRAGDKSPSGMSAEELYETTFTRLFERYLGKGAPLARDLGSIFQGYLQAGPLGGGINGLAAIFGESSGVGKALQSLSKAMPQIGAIMEAQSFIGNLLGNDQIKNGKLLNHIIGPFATALFGSVKRGSANISGSGDEFSVGVTGNTKSYKKAAVGASDSVIGTVQQLADRLGGSINASLGSVSIGRSGDSWHVDTTGRGRLKKSQGGFDFDDDYEAAVRFATMDLIKDGVITGLRASTQRLVAQGKDLEDALQKALDFESVFTRLKEYRDPVGAALDELDKEFTRLKGIFGEAGASAAEYADLEALYGLERSKAIEEAASRITSSLQSLFDDLTIGENGRSLRDRMSAAQAAYDPLKARVLAGDKTAYDAYAEAAKSLLDIQRQFSGSQTPYFALLDEITQITKSRIDAEKNVVSIAENRDSPFGSNGKATGASDNAAVVGAIGQTNDILAKGFGALIAAAGGGGATNGFLSRAFQ